MKKRKLFVALLCSSIVFLSCDKQQDEVVEGWRPIYSTGENNNTVEMSAGEPLQNPGRIYVYEELLLVNEKSRGIHIYDNSNNSSPIEVSFISIPGNMDFSIKNGIMYADNVTDLVVIDIHNPADPQYLNRIENVFPVQQFPDEFGAFECVDPSKGTVVGWERAQLRNPECFR